MKEIVTDFKRSLYNDILITRIDESTQEKQIIELEELENEERANHFGNMDFTLLECTHCRKLRVDKMVPKCFMATHVYISNSTQVEKNTFR